MEGEVEEEVESKTSFVLMEWDFGAPKGSLEIYERG